jgi:hypothetical protein
MNIFALIEYLYHGARRWAEAHYYKFRELVVAR